jgi:hypothetical protein
MSLKSKAQSPKSVRIDLSLTPRFSGACIGASGTTTVLAVSRFDWSAFRLWTLDFGLCRA